MEQIIMTINKSIIYLDKFKTLITFVLAVFKIKYVEQSTPSPG